MTSRRRTPVVSHKLLGFGPRGTRWKLTLRCGHSREVEQGRLCSSADYGAQYIGRNWYLCVPKSLVCWKCRAGERPVDVDPLWAVGARPFVEGLLQARGRS